MMNNMRAELSDEIKKAHKELQTSMEKRIRLLEESLLEEVRQIHEEFNQQRCQTKKTKKDWLHSYTQLQTVVVVLAAYVAFKTCVETCFGALFVFFVLVEGVLLSTEKILQKLKDVINK